MTVMAFCGCAGKPDLSGIKNLAGNKIWVLGHGGMGMNSIHRSNTISSVLEAIECGANGVELDIQMTKDQVLVAYHDEYLEPSTDCHGMINGHTWQEIKNCKYGWFNKVLSIDTLMQALENQRDILLSFDCKLIHADDQIQFSGEFAEALKRSIEKYHISDRVFIESTDWRFLELLKNAGLKTRMFFYTNTYDRAIAMCEKLDLFGVSISMENISKKEIELLHQQGYYVMLFGASSRNKNVKAINMSPDFIQTDNVSFLHEALENAQITGVGEL